MNIEIKLDDPRYCDGCPCKIVHGQDEDVDSCTKDYWDWDSLKLKGKKFIRPQECIDVHGE